MRDAGDIRALLAGLGRVLDGGLAGLPASSQAVYLRLLWWAGLRSGHARASVDRLITATGLSRGTVRAALRDLQARGLIRVSERAGRRPTLWWVDPPPRRDPPLPEALPTPGPAVRWLADTLEPEDLELARELAGSLSPAEREELEREARERFGAADGEELEKAVLELVVRRRFGPARLRRYGL